MKGDVMKQIKVKVNANQVTVDNASQFLSALAIMRGGIEILTNDGVNEYANKLSAAFPSLFPTVDSVLELLKAIGRIVVDDHNWPILPDEQQMLITAALMNVSSEHEGFQFRSLTTGSLDGVFEDLFDRIGKLFQDLLATSSSVVGGGEGKKMKESLRKILADSERPRETQLAAAGVVMIGAEKYRKILDAMKATGVEVPLE
jgi:hypothetical protein